ncbi:MAG TPA: MotA/TolQ/ExbB proton channel family protein [Opitutaceae bacterium]|nr:MotA/TolQ/ExbB proton channel family protein [Opitutaceae bacterium]
MKAVLICVLVSLPLLARAEAAPTFDQTMEKAAAEYRQRAEAAAAELNRTRTQIADEEAPILKRIHAAEDRIVAAESDETQMETQQQNAADTRQKLLKGLEEIRKTTSYLATLAHDSIKAESDGLAPGADQRLGDRLREMQQKLDAGTDEAGGQAAMDAADFLLARTEEALGGYRTEGSAILAQTNQVVSGTFAYVGPETYFLPSSGTAPGTVRPREGTRYPVSYSLADWKAADAAAFFSGQPAMIPADASGGKALRLVETRGGVWQHIEKGGAVAIVIVIVGLLSAAMIIQKFRDLHRMEMDTSAVVETFLDTVSAGDFEQARVALPTLRRTTRELYAVGLRNVDQPKAILEERLQAVLLEQRLHYERRLPLLAVIATAAPLMGLLGTVVGMVNTFALITVFGTGNAGKLSSGISEVLVSTELGLAVAIPTLVVHGFIAQRVLKNLAQLERFALQFVTAVQVARIPATETDGQSLRP